jgi:hypothetical protein
MVEQSKFAGALARLKQPAPEPLSDTPDAALARRKGRPAGKRSDPAWKPYTVLLRKETHKGVSRRLQDIDAGQDLSELVDELLTEWLAR